MRRNKHLSSSHLFILLFGFFYCYLSVFGKSPISDTGSPSPIRSGPMLGYSTHKEVKIWVQTKMPAKVYAEYFLSDDSKKKHLTQEVISEHKNGNVAHLIADELEPGKSYDYIIYINGKYQEPGSVQRFKTQPIWIGKASGPPEIKFALGSCAFVNDAKYDTQTKPYGGEYFIYKAISSKNPEFMLWMGDNIYLREPDWESRTGFIYRYTNQRALPDLQPLLANVHHYAIWDDHDWGPNDGDASFWMGATAEEMFKLFWANPNYSKKGIYGSFTWGDAQFFLTDDRSFRTANDNKTGERSYLGKKQLDWLVNGLAFSKATFKFVVVGGQALNPLAVFENYSTYAEERNLLLSKIQKLKLKNVIFLTGDRHFTELSYLEEGYEYPLYDLTVSPLTSSTHPPITEKNPIRVEGTLVDDKRNFGTIEIAGPLKQRALTFRIFDAEGKELWNREIKAK
ncbi:alkaline phosphatase D family protein [Leptospira semungkisensis]